MVRLTEGRWVKLKRDVTEKEQLVSYAVDGGREKRCGFYVIKKSMLYRKTFFLFSFLYYLLYFSLFLKK